VRKSLGKCSLGRPKKRLDYNNKIGLREIGHEDGGRWNWLRIVSNSISSV
jgi:hypothetical protein